MWPWLKNGSLLPGLLERIRAETGDRRRSQFLYEHSFLVWTVSGGNAYFIIRQHASTLDVPLPKDDDERLVVAKTGMLYEQTIVLSEPESGQGDKQRAGKSAVSRSNLILPPNPVEDRKFTWPDEPLAESARPTKRICGKETYHRRWDPSRGGLPNDGPMCLRWRKVENTGLSEWRRCCLVRDGPVSGRGTPYGRRPSRALRSVHGEAAKSTTNSRTSIFIRDVVLTARREWDNRRRPHRVGSLP